MMTKIKLRAGWKVVVVCGMMLAGVGAVVFAAEDAASLVRRGQSLMEQGKYADALEAFSRASGVAPADAVAAEGVRQARLQLRAKMGDIAADRVGKLLNQLDQLDDHSTAALQAKVRELEQVKGNDTARIRALENDLTAAREATEEASGQQKARIAQAESNLRAAQAAATAADQQVATLRTQLAKATADKPDARRLTQLEAENRQLAEQKQAAEQKAADTVAELRKVQKPVPEDKRVRELQQELGRLKAASQAGEQQQQALQGQMNQTAEENKSLLAKLNEAQQDLFELRSQKGDIGAEARGLAAKLAEKDRENSQLQKRIDTLESAAGTSSREVASLQQRLRVAEDAREAAVKAAGKGADDKYKVAMKDNGKLSRQVADLQKQAEGTRRAQEKAEAEVARLRQQLAATGEAKPVAASDRKAAKLASERDKLLHELQQSRREEAQAEFRLRKLMARHDDTMRELDGLKKQLAQ